MDAKFDLLLNFFALIPNRSDMGNLEPRLDRFLMSDRHSESLDSESYNRLFGREQKADYLLGNQQFVAELKTLTASPKSRLELRLKKRLTQPDAPIVFGSLGMSKIIDEMPDGKEFSRLMLDLAGRSVRRHISKSIRQIRNTKLKLDLPRAAGLTILANNSEPMINLRDAAYSVKVACDANPDDFQDFDYIWLINENHHLRAPDGRLGFGQAIISKTTRNASQLDFVGRMLDAWAAFNDMELLSVPHRSDWDSVDVVFKNGAPHLSGY